MLKAFLKTGMEGLEPPKWLDQNQLPYHLATSHRICIHFNLTYLFCQGLFNLPLHHHKTAVLYYAKHLRFVQQWNRPYNHCLEKKNGAYILYFLYVHCKYKNEFCHPNNRQKSVALMITCSPSSFL